MTVLQLAPWISQLSQSQGGEKGPGIDQMLTRTLQGQVGPVGPRGSTGKYSVYTVYIYEKKKKLTLHSLHKLYWLINTSFNYSIVNICSSWLLLITTTRINLLPTSCRSTRATWSPWVSGRAWWARWPRRCRINGPTRTPWHAWYSWKRCEYYLTFPHAIKKAEKL